MTLSLLDEKLICNTVSFLASYMVVCASSYSKTIRKVGDYYEENYVLP